MIGQYDGDIAFGDREFGRFVRELKAAGLYEDALVVFLADHGEEFLDHGRWLHGRSLFDELIRVPLLVKLPGNRGAGQRVAEQVQGLDVVPTVLEAMGLPLPRDLGGQPVQRTLAKGGSKPRPALAEISHRGFVAYGARTEGDKYVRRFSPDDDELYFDLRRDPKEQASSAGQNPQRVRLLQAQSEAGMSPNPFRYVVEVAGAGRFALKVETRGWLEGVETTGLGPGERSSLGGNGRWLELSLQRAPARRARSDSPCARWGRRSLSAGRATAGPCARRTSRWARAPSDPSRSPSASPTSSPRPRRTGASACSPPRPRALPVCGSGSPCPRAGRSRRWTRRRARG